ncbi:NUDIX domain-containing protein [Streptomyces sp. NPDC059080]|uniref:NUDIX domain-containing protein n=1 Tax=Streptomyces sp. NPDC059080 TaxID=3346718 RepID=UPI0036B1909C
MTTTDAPMTQATEAGAVTREMTDYLREHPEEQGALMTLYDALCDHARRGRCPHGGRCPEILAGALLLDERGRVLLLRHGSRWAFPEGAPQPGDLSLRDTAYALLREFGGVREAWAPGVAEGPVMIDVTQGRPVRVGFRYLFVTHGGAVPSVVLARGLARWAALGEIDGRIAARLRPFVAAV